MGKVGGWNQVVIENIATTDTTSSKPVGIDAKGRILRLPYWPTDAGGSIDYVVPGFGVKVDSVDRTYTVSVDTSVIAKKDSIRLQQPLYVVGDTMKFNPDSSGLVKDIYKKAGTDSVYKTINGVDVFAYVDGGGGDTTDYISNIITNSEKRVQYFLNRNGDTVRAFTWKADIGNDSAYKQPSIDYFNATKAKRFWQGVGVYNDQIFTLTDQDSSGTANNIIQVYDLYGRFIREKKYAYTATDSSGSHFMSFGSGMYFDGLGYFYVTVYNLNGGGAAPYISRVIKYDIATLSVQASYEIGNGVAESVTFYSGSFWVCYHNSMIVRQFDTAFTLQNEYSLPRTIGSYGGYQSIIFENGFVYLNMHGPNTYGSTPLGAYDKYSFNGTSFTYIETITPPTYGCGQGVASYKGKYYWTDRPSNSIVITSYLGELGNWIIYNKMYQ